jgi:hypothetical protein
MKPTLTQPSVLHFTPESSIYPTTTTYNRHNARPCPQTHCVHVITNMYNDKAQVLNNKIYKRHNIQGTTERHGQTSGTSSANQNKKKVRINMCPAAFNLWVVAERILSRVEWYTQQKWRVLVRMIGFISTLVTQPLLITVNAAMSLIYIFYISPLLTH